MLPILITYIPYYNNINNEVYDNPDNDLITVITAWLLYNELDQSSVNNIAREHLLHVLTTNMLPFLQIYTLYLYKYVNMTKVKNIEHLTFTTTRYHY